MNNQGFIGALSQYWDIEPKPRLNRRNTYFDDIVVDNVTALKFGLGFSILAIAIFSFWSLLGVVL